MLATRIFGLLCLIVAMDAARGQENGPMTVEVELTDGSRIIGVPEGIELQTSTPYGPLVIPLNSVDRFDRQADETLRVEFNNGDQMTVVPQFKEVELVTLFGDVRLALAYVQSLVVVPPRIAHHLPVQKGLVLYYPFDEQPQPLVLNATSDSLHATNHGAKWTKGLDGGAIEFSNSSYLSVAHDDVLCPKTFTITAWLYPLESSSSYQMLFAKTNSSSWSGGYGLVRSSGNASGVQFFVNGYTSVYQPFPLKPKRWTHVACVADQHGVRVYIDGQPIDSSSERSKSTTAVAHTKQPLKIGGDDSSYTWNGRMDEFAIYNRVLSDHEIERLYRRHANRVPKVDDTPVEEPAPFDPKSTDPFAG